MTQGPRQGTSPPARLVLHLAAGGASGYGHLARSRAIAAAARHTLGWEVQLVVEVHGDLQVTLPTGAVTCPDQAHALDARRALAASSPIPAVLATDLPERHLVGWERAQADGFVAAVLVNATVATADQGDLAFLREPPPPGWVDTDRVLAGLAYEVVREEAARHRPAEPWAGPEVRSLLVTFGGSDPGELSEQIVDQLPQIEGATTRLVLGPGVAAERVDRIRHAPGAVEVVVDPPSLPELLLGADLVVLAGGQTLIEALHLGRPVAAVRWGSLSADVEWLADMGLVADLGSPPTAVTRLRTLVEQPDRLVGLAAAGFRVIDGAGADRCVSAMAQLLAR